MYGRMSATQKCYKSHVHVYLMLDRVPVPVIPIQGRTLLLCKIGARSRAIQNNYIFFNCMSLQSGAPLGEKYHEAITV